MSNLGRALSTEAGRAAFAVYAEDSVRMRIRKRWEKRREETARPRRTRVMGSNGFPIPVVTAKGGRDLRSAIEADGAELEDVPFGRPMEGAEAARNRRRTTDRHRARIILVR